jgi:hypothetical protein
VLAGERLGYLSECARAVPQLHHQHLRFGPLIVGLAEHPSGLLAIVGDQTQHTVFG